MKHIFAYVALNKIKQDSNDYKHFVSFPTTSWARSSNSSNKIVNKSGIFTDSSNLILLCKIAAMITVLSGITINCSHIL